MPSPENTNTNGVENNEQPKKAPENVETKEISQEEFLNWMDNEGNMFKSESVDLMKGANSINLDEPTFEKVKGETGVVQELAAVDTEASAVIIEGKNKLSNISNMENQPAPQNPSRIDELKNKERRTTEEDFEVVNDTIKTLIQKHAEMIKNRSQFSGSDIDEVEEALTDLNKQREEMLGLMAVAPKQKELDELQKEFDRDVRQNERASNNPDEAFVSTTESKEKIAKLKEEIQGTLAATEYKAEREPTPSPVKEMPKVATEAVAPVAETKEQSAIEQQIQGVSSLNELYKVLTAAGGIQGSSEHFSAEQVLDTVRAYINGQAEETVITRSGGLREKVKELKAAREQKQGAQNVAPKEVVSEKQPAPKEFKTVSVKRSNGDIESDWNLVSQDDKNAVVMKKDPATGELIQKVIPKSELEQLNPSSEAKYTPGKQVTVRRSDGSLESDWKIGNESRILNGKKAVMVYKGEYPPKEGTVRREVYQDELNELNP